MTKKPTANEAVEGSHAGTGSRCHVFADTLMQMTAMEPDAPNFKPRMARFMKAPSPRSHALQNPIRKKSPKTVATVINPLLRVMRSICVVWGAESVGIDSGGGEVIREILCWNLLMEFDCSNICDQRLSARSHYFNFTVSMAFRNSA